MRLPAAPGAEPDRPEHDPPAGASSVAPADRHDRRDSRFRAGREDVGTGPVDGGVRLSVDGPVATISLERADVHNAQLPQTWEALERIGSQLAGDIRTVIVRGAGPSFSAGLDRAVLADTGADGLLTSLATADAVVADARISGFQRAFSWLSEVDAVTIAAVHGHAIGAGFQLALACDIIVAAESARFRMAEVSLGLVPDLGGTGRLARRVGTQRALEICATGRTVGGSEAAAIGLALRCVPDDAIETAVTELVTALLAAPPASVRAVTRLMRAAGGSAPVEQRIAERAEQLTLLRALAARTAT